MGDLGQPSTPAAPPGGAGLRPAPPAQLVAPTPTDPGPQIPGPQSVQRFWDWHLARRPLSQPADLRLTDLQAYQSQRVAHEGVTATTVNRVLNYVLTALREQADAGVPADAAIFRLRPLPEPHRLPRYLPDSDCQRLQTFVQTRLDSPDPLIRLENACFLVLAHTGLRASECVYLQVGDLDLPGRRLVVRQGQGRKDRVVYLSDLAVQALTRYLGPIPRPRALVDPPQRSSPALRVAGQQNDRSRFGGRRG
ncbi:MAG: hypothetical protein DPW09_14965 [Anaerolineae bacterium]|nr:hypothetical protein [Anaerolineae bacterium]